MSRPTRKVRERRALSRYELAAALAWALFACIGGGACLWMLFRLCGFA